MFRPTWPSYGNIKIYKNVGAKYNIKIHEKKWDIIIYIKGRNS